jgi:hypothetical protein
MIYLLPEGVRNFFFMLPRLLQAARETKAANHVLSMC